MAEQNISMEKIISLCKRRGFVFPGSEIYGGLANSWDFGPLGVELKNNIKKAWWKKFVQERLDMVGLDSAIISNPKVWEASGHLKEFQDPLVECKKCHKRFRADEIGSACPECQGELTAPRPFSGLLKTFLGPTEDKSAETYLRPETAQGIFIDFASILQVARKKLPFGVAQIGKAFRNEITPGNFIFRTREFEQMEIEYFIEEKDWEKCFGDWLEDIRQWLKGLGIKEIIEHEIPDGERAHYSKRTIDIEFDFPFGRKELMGLAYRGNYDLTQHQKSSGQSLEYFNAENNEKVVPHVIEPSMGVDRLMLAILVSSFKEEEIASSGEEKDQRMVMQFTKELAPIKIAVLPLSKKPELEGVSREIWSQLSKKYMTDFDVTGSIGKRYRRQDEIGTPYCVTVDFNTLEDQAVTVRDRDTMQQERIKIEELEKYFQNQFSK